MKIIILYVLSLGLAWAGLVSVLTGWTARPQPGAFLPLATGLLALAVSARLWLALVRLYRTPDKSWDRLN